MASCSNLFEVDGNIEELGFDHLKKLRQRTQGLRGNALNVANNDNSYVAQNETFDFEMNQMDNATVSTIGESGKTHEDAQNAEKDALNPIQMPGLTDSGNTGNDFDAYSSGKLNDTDDILT